MAGLAIDPLAIAARHAKWVLAIGLAVGVCLPALASFLSAYLVPLIILIMFLGALRLRADERSALWSGLAGSLVIVLALQVVVPLAFAVGFAGLGQLHKPWALVTVLVLSAPAIMSSPNMAAILKLDAGGALRLMVLGTVLVPVTSLPALTLLFPEMGSGAVGLAALRLALIIVGAGGVGLIVGRMMRPHISVAGAQRLDGISALSLGVFVIALMPALRTTFLADPVTMLLWICYAFVLNIGLQVVCLRLALKRVDPPLWGDVALISGNRNLALFFAAIPGAQTADLLPFLAAYQFPMFLTPLLLSGLYCGFLMRGDQAGGGMSRAARK